MNARLFVEDKRQVEYSQLRNEMNPHRKFFSSLKQVEKRLKVENGELPSTSSQYNSTSTASEVSPLYLDSYRTNNSCESETPCPFLSNHHSSTQSQNESDQLHLMDSETDEIDKMMELLGLSGAEDATGCYYSSYNCEDSFYEKIVGVKGPKCGKEVDRLNGWIEYFYNCSKSETGKEPFKLAHLLLGKASFLSGDDDPELEFPSTLAEFLKNDPPLLA